ncbi:LysR family transcriptional regulator [Cereibacter johrii]|uniref:LysR family transcriptional regulator n=1 Tax=Cereibacter johrii TaxID=445629 RepID=UPI003CE8F59A
MIDRSLLMILREVDRTGSLTAASGRLNLTQSALSHTIRRFEERHGVDLWRKEGRSLRFTEAGDHLLALAHRVLPQIDHSERVIADFAAGQRGALRVGMECHPCQQWLMRVVAPYLAAWPNVDLDLRTAFRFGGIGALLGHEIDVLITPDPLDLPGILYRRVFDYEIVLAVPANHALAAKGVVEPADLSSEVLITYPVEPERLDIFTRFLVPGRALPRRHRTVETTEMMLHLVAAGRGVSSVPDWLLEEARVAVRAVRLGPDGLAKSLHLGVRRGEETALHLAAFLDLAQATGLVPQPAPAE